MYGTVEWWLNALCSDGWDAAGADGNATTQKASPSYLLLTASLAQVRRITLQGPAAASSGKEDSRASPEHFSWAVHADHAGCLPSLVLHRASPKAQIHTRKRLPALRAVASWQP